MPACGVELGLKRSLLWLGRFSCDLSVILTTARLTIQKREKGRAWQIALEGPPALPVSDTQDI